ncbi:two-component system, sensor histidine kinase and response regulator [Gammaproteobacteria bacterium]
MWRHAWLGYFIRHILVTGLLLGAWSGLVWVGGNRLVTMRVDALVEAHGIMINEHADALSYNLHRSLAFLHALPIHISTDEEVANAVRTYSSEAIPPTANVKEKAAVFLSHPELVSLSRQLAKEAGQFGVDIAWILNIAGDCIATSNFNQPQTLLGTRFRDRDYFKMAMEGNLGHQFAVGRTTGVLGVYFSAPIMVGERVMGVVVIKLDLVKLSPLLGSTDSFVTDEYGIIIMARRPALVMHALPENRLMELSPEAREFRYKQRYFPKLDITPWNNFRATRMFRFDGSPHPYLITTRAETAEGMTVHVIDQLEEIDRIKQDVHQIKVAIFIAGVAVLLFVGGVIMHMRRSARHVRELRENQIILKEKQVALEAEKRRAEAATEAKALFLANMSHEIRTPMNGVIGLGQLALKSCQDHKQKDYLQKILSSATSLLNIINDILDFSKIESGNFSIEAINFNMKSVLDGVANVIAMRASEKHLELLFHVAPNVPSYLIGDSLRLGQVLLNLINNAIKFTERGEVVLSITVVEQRETEIDLSFSVHDTGIGLTLEQQSRLFQSFNQADASTTRRFGGTGLGLAISKRIVELMGGAIKVESEPGVGSTFSFTAAFGIYRQCDGEAPIVAQLQSNPRVLVVDDNAMAREILSSMLISWSMQVQTATGGLEALAALRHAAADNAPFDLILLDWQMPEPNGLATAKAIMASEEVTKKPHIIMNSAYYRHDEIMAEAVNLGIGAFLIKPIEKSLLLETITTLLVKSERSSHINQLAPVVMTSRELREARILLAEDNEINQQIAIEFLTDAGAQVDLAVNGREAVTKVLEGDINYDAVLMDVQMPEMDGLEATRRIRERLGAIHLPIIAMTAHAMETERKRCLLAGMDDHITKPIVPTDLIETLTRWITPRKTTAEADRLKPPTEPLPPPPVVITPPPDFPDFLPPFDLAAAVARMNGKRGVVRKVLVSFHKSFGNAPTEFERLVGEGRFDELLRLAHTLKGIAATLEAAALTKAAAALETALLNTHTDDVRSLVDALKIELLIALAAAARITPAVAASELPQPLSVIPIIHRDELNRLIAELQTLLAKNSAKARKAVIPLREALVGCNLDSHLNTLATHLERFDFRGAENALATLTAGLPSQESNS